MLDAANLNDASAASPREMSAAGRAAAERAARRCQQQAAASTRAAREGLRAANEDDDGYDPYVDYMDAPGAGEPPCADPWR